MNKSELIEITAKEADITKAAAEKVLAAIIGAITKAVSKGDSVALIGFGSFKASKRAARTGVNPKTGEKLKEGEVIHRCACKKFKPQSAAPHWGP